MKKRLTILLVLINLLVLLSIVAARPRYLRPQVNTVGLVAHYKLWDGLMTTGTDVELVTDGVFANWTGDDPDDWTVIGEVGAGIPGTRDPEVSQVGHLESHADAGGEAGGMCNLYTSEGTAIIVKQIVSGLVVGKRYRFSIIVDTRTAGGIKIHDALNGQWTQLSITSAGTHTTFFVATHTSCQIYIQRRNVGEENDVTFDNVSIKEATPYVFDYSLNGNQGTVLGANTLPVYPGFEFDGGEGYIAVSDADTLDVTAVTISAWVNLDSSWSAQGYIVAKLEDWAASGEISYTLQIGTTKKVGLSISDDGDIPTDTEASDDAISVSTWHHIVGTYDGAGAYKIYVNGSLVASNGAGSATGTIHIGTGRLALGARYDSSASAYAHFFNGKIDDVMIFKTVKSATEIKSIYEVSRWRYSR